ncbi:exosortase H [Tahibacter amnicola]|uniref:Exosortase H n=1 Tax=Tahibacter amnicola TaxID=2976241 RepID=A0ABY6BH34_9GAMM|nr:exosortase H [Tahibacter amnicola]UXI69336.1 exosortase H [Tahibacter amnicola]
MYRFLLIFVLSLLVFFTLDVLVPVEKAVIDPFNAVLAWISAHVISLFGGDAVSYGKQILSAGTGLAVSIERVCNGIEAVLVLVSAMIAFPTSWKHKVIGILIGTVAIQSLNVVRIISLYYLHQWDKTWFEWFHLYIWQALIVLDALVVFLVWLRYLPRPAPPSPPRELQAAV